MELMFMFWVIVASHHYSTPSGTATVETHRTEFYYDEYVETIVLYHSKEECMKHVPPDNKANGTDDYDCEQFAIPAIEVIGAAKIIKNLPNSLD